VTFSWPGLSWSGSWSTSACAHCRRGTAAAAHAAGAHDRAGHRAVAVRCSTCSTETISYTIPVLTQFWLTRRRGLPRQPDSRAVALAGRPEPHGWRGGRLPLGAVGHTVQPWPDRGGLSRVSLTLSRDRALLLPAHGAHLCGHRLGASVAPWWLPARVGPSASRWMVRVSDSAYTIQVEHSASPTDWRGSLRTRARVAFDRPPRLSADLVRAARGLLARKKMEPTPTRERCGRWTRSTWG